jgi:hypothetical protein
LDFLFGKLDFDEFFVTSLLSFDFLEHISVKALLFELLSAPFLSHFDQFKSLNLLTGSFLISNGLLMIALHLVLSEEEARLRMSFLFVQLNLSLEVN